MEPKNPAGRATELAAALLSELSNLRSVAPNVPELAAAESSARQCLAFLEKAVAGGIIRDPYPNATEQTEQ